MAEHAGVVPDQWLLWGMAQGDAEAEYELRRRHSKSLYALAYGVLWDSDVADAVVARAFDHAARTSGEFHATKRSVFGWLAGITRTQAERAASSSLAHAGAAALRG